MQFKKGKSNTNEWEQMIVHNEDVCMGVHYISKEITSKEKIIIEKHLKLAAEEDSIDEKSPAVDMECTR